MCLRINKKIITNFFLNLKAAQINPQQNNLKF